MRAIRCLVTVGILAAGTGTLAAEEIARDFHREFQVSEGARLELLHGDGDVTITPWERDVVDVKVRYRVDVTGVAAGGKRDLEVEFSQEGDLIRVVDREKRSGSVGFLMVRKHEHSYTVQAPPWVELSLEGEDGDVEIGGWRSPVAIDLEDGDVDLSDVAAPKVEIDVEDGDVDLRDVEAELDLEVEDGDVEIERSVFGRARIRIEDGDLVLAESSGDLDVQSEDGDLRLSGLRAGALDVTTSDGDVVADLLPAAAAPQVTLRTEDGDVVLAVAPEISARFDISTRDGAIRLDLARAEEVEKKRNRASGRLGDGAGMIRIATSDGSATLRDR